MGEKDTVNIKTTADLLENEKTEQRKKDAEAIEAKQKEAAEKAEEARREQERKEQELAARKAEQEEQRAKEKDLLKYTALKLYFNFCKRYNGKGEPSPQLEGLANAFLRGIAPGL